MTLTIQSLTYNYTATLPQLYESLKNQTDRDWNIFHLDNASTVENRSIIKSCVEEAKKDLPITSFWGDTNISFAGGHQFLFEKHTSDYVFLLNDDAILEPNYIARLKEFLNSNPKVGAVSGKILRFYINDTGEAIRTSVIDSCGLQKTRWHSIYDIGANKESSSILKPFKVFGVSGCLPIYRRAAILDSTPKGYLFDPIYFYYKEDVDLAYRMKNHGWDAYTVPEAIAYHKRTFKPSIVRTKISYFRQYCSYVNHWRNLIRNLTLRDWLKDGIFILPYETSKIVYVLGTHPSILWKILTGKVRKGITF